VLFTAKTWQWEKLLSGYNINMAWAKTAFVISKKELKDETKPPIKETKICLYHIA
jgi:hypothetical protein